MSCLMDASIAARQPKSRGDPGQNPLKGVSCGHSACNGFLQTHDAQSRDTLRHIRACIARIRMPETPPPNGPEHDATPGGFLRPALRAPPVDCLVRPLRARSGCPAG